MIVATSCLPKTWQNITKSNLLGRSRRRRSARTLATPLLSRGQPVVAKKLTDEAILKPRANVIGGSLTTYSTSSQGSSGPNRALGRKVDRGSETERNYIPTDALRKHIDYVKQRWALGSDLKVDLADHG